MELRGRLRKLEQAMSKQNTIAHEEDCICFPPGEPEGKRILIAICGGVVAS